MPTRDTPEENVFNRIAESWYRLRHWSRFKSELAELSVRWQGGRLLNIGCAHGPDFLPFKDNFELWGIDSAEQMIRLAIRHAGKFKYQPNLLVADAVELPFRDGSFDWVIAVAIYHHIQGKKNRKKAFRELKRILKPGGEFFITVWNRWQPAFWRRGKEVFVPWNINEQQVNRYHYLYTYPEIAGLLKSCDLSIVKMFPEASYRRHIKYFSQNICVLGRNA